MSEELYIIISTFVIPTSCLCGLQHHSHDILLCGQAELVQVSCARCSLYGTIYCDCAAESVREHPLVMMAMMYYLEARKCTWSVWQSGPYHSPQSYQMFLGLV